MTRRGLLIVSLVGLSLLVLLGFKLRVVVQQRAAQAALVAQQRQLDADLAAVRREQAALAADLKQAEQQLVAVPATTSALAPMPPERRAEIDRWLAGVRRLRELFDQRPGQRIPEMQFLKEADWLRTAKINPLETEDDIRAALAEIRSAGMSYFSERLSAALRKYTAATKGEPPASIQVLAPYFDPTVDPLILARYTIMDRVAVGSSNGPKWGVANKDPIDPDYESRYQILGNGNGMTIGSGLLSWMPELMDRYRTAGAKYRRTNPGRSATAIDDLLPFFDPPLERELADRLKKVESRR